MCLDPSRSVSWQGLHARVASSAARGMTLIELMIVVAVIALLGAVALPSYQSSVRKSHRADAKAALTKAAQRLERFYTENNKYDPTGTSTRLSDLVDSESENKYYALSISFTSGVPTVYLLTATPQNSQADDACGKFTINQNGDRGLADTSLTVAECW